ncbi:MAG: alpha-glucan family phosphorylase [Nitriliruptoraceae bacterium]
MTDHAAVRADLVRLARNLRWFADQPTRRLFEALADDLREAGATVNGRDPMAVVTALDDATLHRIAGDPDRLTSIQEVVASLDAELAGTPALRDGARIVAYFSAEFALSDTLFTYSGGLGVLAGDHLRSASDLGLPLVGIGLAYRDGYFLQQVDEHGQQHALPARNELANSPAEPVVDPLGERLRVEVPMGDGTVQVEAWRIAVGRVPLVLLDTDVEANAEHHRSITRQLYGGDEDTRLRQELVLGVGGVRMLEAMGLDPSIYHLNEGHAAFAGLEQLGRHRRAGHDLDVALARVRDELQFTTHTPVPAGHDTFHHNLARYHLQPLAHQIDIAFEDLWELATGRGFDSWNQTVLSLRLAGRTNGVARLHGQVSRAMFSSLWPDRPVDEVPIDHVTNGVHPSSWVGPDTAELLDDHVPGWQRGTDAPRWAALRAVDRARFWEARRRARGRLLTVVRQRLDERSARTGAPRGGEGLDPDALTIGFARRFATYKRGSLVLRDLERLGAILADEDRPVQLLVAGKAHPADADGQALIRAVVEASGDTRLAGRLVFIERYNLELGGLLTSGCDVWLNTPVRPLEASGTSGMKSAMNGGLNLSVLDGWWDEAMAEQGPQAEAGIGWAIGDRTPVEDPEARDAQDADELYRLLTDEVVPTFHERDPAGLPQRWLTMALDAMVLLSPVYSTHRMVSEYAGRYGIEHDGGPHRRDV